MEIDLTLAMAIIGCSIGICGWLSGREKTVGDESEWRGNVNAKLDLILTLQKDIVEIENTIKSHDTRLVVVENSAKACHRRMDDFVKGEFNK